jgi:hypothetical protein
MSWSSVFGGSFSPSPSMRWSSSSFILHARSMASRGGGGGLSLLTLFPLPLRFPLREALCTRSELILSCVDWPFFDDLCFLPLFLRLSHGSTMWIKKQSPAEELNKHPHLGTDVLRLTQHL